MQKYLIISQWVGLRLINIILYFPSSVVQVSATFGYNTGIAKSTRMGLRRPNLGFLLSSINSFPLCYAEFKIDANKPMYAHVWIYTHFYVIMYH